MTAKSTCSISPEQARAHVRPEGCSQEQAHARSVQPDPASAPDWRRSWRRAVSETFAQPPENRSHPSQGEGRKCCRQCRGPAQKTSAQEEGTGNRRRGSCEGKDTG